MIDLEVFSQYPKDVFKEALEIFLEDTDEHISALNEKSFTEVKNFAHKIKGSTGMLGAHKLHQLAAQVETTVNDQNATILLNAIIKSYEELKMFINEEFLSSPES